VIERWLVEQDPEEVSAVLDIQVVTADETVDEDALYDYLGHELLRNYVVPGELEAIFRDLGVPEVADHLASHKFPTNNSIRTGDFGEAMSGALFRRTRRWCVPILKLRYKQRPNQPVQGADFLGFRLRQSPAVVAVPEVKTRTDTRLNVGVEASTSLDHVLEELPSSVEFVVARLLEQHNALAPRVARLLDEGFTIERHIVLVHDDDKWDDRITERLAAAEDERTRLTVVRLGSLKDIIQRTFDEAMLAPGRLAGRGAGTSDA
jgi:hypothetical protein